LEDPKLILMSTSPGQRVDSALWRELGIVTSVTKPVSRRALAEVLQRVLAPARQGSGSVTAVATEARSTVEISPRGSLRLLLAEDNLVNQKVACRLLEKQGHTVTVAANGLEALGFLDRAEFDVVLMDVQMPEMDGFEATAAIRMKENGENGTGRHIPIVAMTAHAMVGDENRCLQAGMDAYVSKPIAPAALFDAIEAACRDHISEPA
jgi:CheY-like chemotaxis protein